MGKYFDGMTLAEIGAKENISPERARQLQSKSLRTLRRPEHTKRLKSFMDEIIQSKAYQGTGFEAWKAKGSVEERLVEYYEERERHYAMLAEGGIALPGAFIKLPVKQNAGNWQKLTVKKGAEKSRIKNTRPRLCC